MSAPSTPFLARLGRFRRGSKLGDPESPISLKTPGTPHSSGGLLGDGVESGPSFPLGSRYEHTIALQPPDFGIPPPGYPAAQFQWRPDNCSQIDNRGIELQQMKMPNGSTDVEQENIFDPAGNTQHTSSRLNGTENSIPLIASNRRSRGWLGNRVRSRGLDHSSDSGPGDPQTSSSVLNPSMPIIVYDMVSRRRNGTPPGLYGTPAVDNRLSGFSFQTSAGDFQSWETVDGSRNTSTEADRVETNAGGRAIVATGQAGSSLADNSDAGSVSPPKPTPAKLVLNTTSTKSPRDFVFFNRPATRDPEIHPAYRTPEGLGDQNLCEAISNSCCTAYGYRTPLSSRNTYKHPSPLSAEHTNPFASSPPPFRRIREKTDVAMSGSPSPTSPGVTKVEIKQRANEPQSEHNVTRVDTSQLNGSFAKVNVVGSRANVTGTLAGLGTREVGSSLADGSSPVAMLSSDPLQESGSPFADHHTGSVKESEASSSLKDKLRKRHSHDGSLEMGRIAGPDNFYKRPETPDFESELDSVTSTIFDLDSELRSIFDAAQRTPQQPRRRHSTPIELLRSADSTNMSGRPLGEDQAASSGSIVIQDIELQRLGRDTNMQMRMRSPQRAQRRSEEDTTTHITPRVGTPYDAQQSNPQDDHHILHCIQEPSAEFKKIQLEKSFAVLLLTSMVPPILIIYGHGYMDYMCSLLTEGTINEFNDDCKTVALVIGYISSAAIVAAIVLSFDFVH